MELQQKFHMFVYYNTIYHGFNHTSILPIIYMNNIHTTTKNGSIELISSNHLKHVICITYESFSNGSIE
jgi:hypothetical protein